MHTTNRTRSVECPACEGERGEIEETYAGYDSYDGPAVKETWVPCETCEGEGRVQRVDRLAWLIGQARESEPRLSPLTMVAKAEPIVVPAPFPLRKAA